MLKISIQLKTIIYFLVIKSRTNEKENIDAADYKRIRKYEGTFGC